MTETFVSIAGWDEWDLWWAENGDYIEQDREDAFALACNHCLMVGGGGAPLYRIGFVD